MDHGRDHARDQALARRRLGAGALSERAGDALTGGDGDQQAALSLSADIEVEREVHQNRDRHAEARPRFAKSHCLAALMASSPRDEIAT